jgi:putative membrane-bound dehydrogenase-like protein
MHPQFIRVAIGLLLFGLALTCSYASGDDFPTPVNTEPSTEQPMAPDEVVRTATVPDGFRLSVFAAEPDVQNPIAITTDERGRLWVAENYTWAGNSLGNYRTDLSDRILILEDTDGDGRHDKRTVFLDRLKKVTSVEVGFGGVWVLALPHLLFIPDADRDDVPDGPPTVVLDGFNEDSVSHTPANGLRWGPDGWLYARHGILATSSIGPPGSSDSQRIKINTGVWRYHPVRGTVETVMHGMTNSWGFDYNRDGEMFCINTVIGHLWHVIPGARTERMFGIDMNPRAYQLLPQVADHVHWDTGELWHQVRDGVSDSTMAAGGGHAHIGLMIYQGDNWPESYRDKLYTLNLHGRRINVDSLERQGAGYVARHQADMVVFADPFFRGMDLVTGADGGVFICDWSDTGECHDHDGVHRTSGRVYKLTYGPPKPAVSVDLAAASDQELFDAQRHPNAWYGRQARRILQHRAASKGMPIIAAAGRSGASEPTAELHAAWADHAAGAGDPMAMLASSSDAVRAWGVRLLSDRHQPGGDAVAEGDVRALKAATANDPTGIVSLYVAAALQRLPHADRWEIAESLAGRSEFADDRFYPIMVWLGIEAAAAEDTDWAVKLCAGSSLPLVTRNLARLLAERIESDMPSVERLLGIAARADADESGRWRTREILVGVSQALAGWSRAPAPKNWKGDWNVLSASGKHSDDAELRQAVDQLNVVFGDGQAIELLRGIATDSAADPAARRQAVRAISAGKGEGFESVLLDLLGDRAVHGEALKGLAFYDSPETPARALSQMGIYGPEARAELVRLLVSRPAYAAALLQAVADGRIAVDEVSAFHARQIQSFGDESLSGRLAEVWGDVRPTAEDKRATIAALKTSLGGDHLADADSGRGRAVFNKVCANCHVLYGQGRSLGPDLTGSNRHNLDYLLENIVDPSASVGNEFRATVFVLDDGRVVSGVISAQSDRTMTVQTADGVSILDRETILDTKPTGVSLMPEALLQNLSPEEIANLFAYLMTTAQVAVSP